MLVVYIALAQLGTRRVIVVLMFWCGSGPDGTVEGAGGGAGVSLHGGIGPRAGQWALALAAASKTAMRCWALERTSRRRAGAQPR